jgi:cardiolipin synthase
VPAYGTSLASQRGGHLIEVYTWRKDLGWKIKRGDTLQGDALSEAADPVSACPAAQDLEKLLEISTFDGNRIDILVNGDRIFPAMLEGIAQAQWEICFETFIYWSGEIAQEFADALVSAARRGVRVYVLLDWWGALDMEQSLVDRMAEAGAKVRYFNPLSRWQLNRMNYRTHRKIMVVDRRIAFTGGVGIADPWQGDARSADEWHDLHYRIVGPAVRCFQDAFQEIWTEVIEKPQLDAADRAPEERERGHIVAVQVMMSSPRQGAKKVYRAFRYAIESARQSILLTTAYFVPDEESIEVMLAASARGIRFHVMVPGEHNDMKLVRFASKSSWGRLLKGGIHIHVYDPTMLHAKVMVVDDEWTLVGSANFDNRSFSLNDEITMHVFGRDFAGRHRGIFKEDLNRCHDMTLEEWRNRGVWCRVKESVANLVRGHL